MNLKDWKLSERAKTLLLLVDEYSERDTDGTITRTCYINSREYYTRFSKHPIVFGGPGDARILQSLVDKGLITDRGMSFYVVTEEGRLTAEQILEDEYYNRIGHVIRK